jgi:hypothetical protein
MPALEKVLIYGWALIVMAALFETLSVAYEIRAVLP